MLPRRAGAQAGPSLSSPSGHSGMCFTRRQAGLGRMGQDGLGFWCAGSGGRGSQGQDSSDFGGLSEAGAGFFRLPPSAFWASFVMQVWVPWGQ